MKDLYVQASSTIDNDGLLWGETGEPTTDRFRPKAVIEGRDVNEDSMSPHRANIVNLLNLIAAEGDQLDYQKVAPVNVATELVNQWFCDFYHPTDALFQSEFSNEELATLRIFDAYHEARYGMLPDSLDNMLKTTGWQEIMNFASEVLDAHGWRGIEARYDLSD